MRPEVQQRLLHLNRRFYDEFGRAYAEKRGFLQPGVVRLLARLSPQAHVLDVGCGHGRVIQMLRDRGDFRGRYVGVDGSASLLHEAWNQAQAADFPVVLLQRDLARPDWARHLPAVDVALCFAVLHHLPSEALRLRLLRDVRSLLKPGGQVWLSVWNLLRSPRLKARVQPWEQVGLTWADVDPGDLLVDWRHGGRGLRYIHQFTLPELEALLVRAGFRLREMFLEDGEGRRLGIYAVGERENGQD